MKPLKYSCPKYDFLSGTGGLLFLFLSLVIPGPEPVSTLKSISTFQREARKGLLPLSKGDESPILLERKETGIPHSPPFPSPL